MQKDEHGYIVVETATAFTLFVLLCASILSLINIVAVQARVHFALTESATTISMYSYVLEATGAAQHMVASENQGNRVTENVEEFKSNVNSLLGSFNSMSFTGVRDAAGNIINQGRELSNTKPKEILQAALNWGINTGKNELFETAVRPLMLHYLNNGERSGEDFLKDFRIDSGLDFYSIDLLNLQGVDADNSAFIDCNGDIKIVVQYDIDYFFGILPTPMKLHVVQEAVTKAWLGGEGQGYTG